VRRVNFGVAVKIRIVVTVALLAYQPTLFAKCSMPTVVISGVVQDAGGAPISNAVVGVSWMKHGHPHGPAIAISNASGKYAASFSFNTSAKSSWLRGDVCKDVLSEVSVSAYAAGYSFESIVTTVTHDAVSANFSSKPTP
jgi:hypothetical protein